MLYSDIVAIYLQKYNIYGIYTIEILNMLIIFHKYSIHIITEEGWFNFCFVTLINLLRTKIP